MTEAESKYKALKLAIECRSSAESPEATVYRATIFQGFIGWDKQSPPARGKRTD
jgi:hypothetical protein